MSKLTTEQFIQEAAARNWSKTQTLEALGLCRETFYAMLKAMPPLVWPAPGKSLGHQLGNEARRGHCSPALRAAVVKAQTAHKAKASHVVNGVRGSIEEHAARSSVSASTVRRRMNAGMSITEALTTPATPLKFRRNGYGTPEHSARNNA